MLARIGSVTLLLVAITLLHSHCAIAQQAARSIPVKPNKEVQALLHSLGEWERTFPPGTTREDVNKKLLEIRKMAGGVQALVGQLFYYAVAVELMPKGDHMMEAMVPGIVRKLLEISEDDVVAGLLPCLETDDDVALEEAFRHWLLPHN